MEKNKTIRQWLNELPKPYKAQAIKNFDKKARGSRRGSLAQAIHGAFIWSDSNEGFEYWSKFYHSL